MSLEVLYVKTVWALISPQRLADWSVSLISNRPEPEIDSAFKSDFVNKASQAIQSPRTVPFFLLVSLLDGYSFANVLVKNIVAFKH